MAQLGAIRLEEDRVVPDFSLPSLEGGHVGPSQYKQRANLVIAYLDFDQCGECINMVRAFGSEYNQYRELETEILVVSPQSREELSGKLGTMGLPFPVLSDPEGKMTVAYFGSDRPAAAIFITDRYGALRTQFMAESAQELPRSAAMIDWLSLIEIECPECGH